MFYIMLYPTVEFFPWRLPNTDDAGTNLTKFKTSHYLLKWSYRRPGESLTTWRRSHSLILLVTYLISSELSHAIALVITSSTRPLERSVAFLTNEQVLDVDVFLQIHLRLESPLAPFAFMRMRVHYVVGSLLIRALKLQPAIVAKTLTNQRMWKRVRQSTMLSWILKMIYYFLRFEDFARIGAIWCIPQRKHRAIMALETVLF